MRKRLSKAVMLRGILVIAVSFVTFLCYPILAKCQDDERNIRPRITGCSWEGGKTPDAIPQQGPFYVEGWAQPGSSIEVRVKLQQFGDMLGGPWYGTADKKGRFSVKIDRTAMGTAAFLARATDSFGNVSEFSDPFEAVVVLPSSQTPETSGKSHVARSQKSADNRPTEFFEDPAALPETHEPSGQEATETRGSREPGHIPAPMSDNKMVIAMILIDAVLAVVLIYLLVQRRK